MIAYQDEIRKTLRALFYDPIFDESDYDGMIQELFRKTDASYESLSNAIQQGIDNGHPLEKQLSMIQEIFNVKI